MNWFKTTMVLALAVFWPLVTSHCKLEVFSVLSFLACGESAVPHEEECETDGCVAVESSVYKSEDRQLTIQPPLFTALFPLPELNTPDFVVVGPLPSVAPPPLLAGRWQFLHRAAAPPRAPSLAS